MLRAALLLSLLAAIAAESTLVVTGGLQSGIFQTGSDIGSMNPHDYRPNEFITNDFIFEGLTQWDGSYPEGVDGTVDTYDDFVKPSLATSWTTSYDTSTEKYEVTFTLRSGVTFHDGSPWNAAAAKGNFDQIMGGDGSCDGVKAMKGMHDWLGFTQFMTCWSVEGDMTFKLTFSKFYENVLRELTTIRPFRMVSLATLPDMSAGAVSHNAWKWGYPREFPFKCWAADDPRFTGGKTGRGQNGEKEDPCYTMRGVSAPIGTGPYKVVDKLLKTTSGSTRRLPAAEFNASCYDGDTCVYNAGETVSEVLFTKVAGHWKNPSYDRVIFKSYDSVGAIKKALEDGSLDIAYGVDTLSPSAFLSLATAESGADVVAHKQTTDLNTRLVVLNSAGRLNTTNLRKVVMQILAESRAALWDGELAEEEPMDTLFDPEMPHCGFLKDLSSTVDLAKNRPAGFDATSIDKPLRFMYKHTVAHEAMIASWVITRLQLAGINVEAVPVDKAGYNSLNCKYTHPYYYSDDPNHEFYEDDYHAWDIAYSETWGPPYDPSSKLWDMTQRLVDGGWCSAEADAPAVSNMETMSTADYADKVRRLSTTRDLTERSNLYKELLTTLHNEAIFVPLTAKRQTAVTNKRVSGFQFGYMQFDLPLSNLYPTMSPPPPKPPAAPVGSSSDDLSNGAIAGIAIASVFAVLCCVFALVMVCKERAGKPIFTPMGDGKAQA